jgi:hypothetical protein
MRNHFDMQREVVLAALDLIDDVRRSDDVFSLDNYRRRRAGYPRFYNGDPSYLKDIEERADRYGRERSEIDRNWLLSQTEFISERYRHLLRN